MQWPFRYVTCDVRDMLGCLGVRRRGMFGSRQGFGVSDYYMKANHETLTVILIEDILAVNSARQSPWPSARRRWSLSCCSRSCWSA